MENQQEQSTHILRYIIIILVTIAVCAAAGYIYFKATVKQKVEESVAEKKASITVAPTSAIPLVQDALAEIPEFEQKLIAQPGNIETMRKQAQNYIFADKYEKARDAYKQILSVTPDDAKTYYDLGKVEIRLEQYDLAQAAFEKSIELDTKDNLSYVELADIYTIRKPEREKVIETYEAAIKNNPQNITFHVLFASFYEQIGETALAKEQYQKVLSIDPAYRLALEKVKNL